MINGVDWSYYGSLIHQSEDTVRSYGIEVPEFISYDVSRTTRSWGDWRLKKDGCNYIRVTKSLLETGNDKAIMETIIHEILHACYPKDGHTKGWKKAAKRISNDGVYNISRLSNAADKGITDDQMQWMFKITCNNCGKLWYYQKPKNVRAIVKGKGVCPFCKKHKFIVVNKFGEIVK